MRVESTAPTPLRATAATVKRQYSPPGESNCTGSPAVMPSASASREPTMTELGIVSKILKLPGDDLLANIGRPQMERGIDPKEIDRCGFKLGPRRERPAQDRRASNDIGKSPADAHDFGGIGNPLEIAAAGCFHAGVLWRDEQIAVARTKLRPQHDGPVAPEGSVDETFGEALGLRLSANENRDSKNNPAEAENEGAFAVEKKAQRDMERWRHSGFSWRRLFTIRCLTNCPDRSLS